MKWGRGFQLQTASSIQTTCISECVPLECFAFTSLGPAIEVCSYDNTYKGQITTPIYPGEEADGFLLKSVEGHYH